MAVTSREPAPPRRNPAALFQRGMFHNQQHGVRRFLAVLLALLSLVGALIWGGGGVDAWRQLAPVWWGVVGALLFQGLFTYGQWVFGGPGWWNPLYLICWGASTLMTVLGYWPLVHRWVAAQLLALAGGNATSVLGYYAPWLAGGIIIIVAALLDWLPEQTLLD